MKRVVPKDEFRKKVRAAVSADEWIFKGEELWT